MPSSFSLFHFCGFPAELQKSIEQSVMFPNLLFLDGQLMFIKVKHCLFTVVGVIIPTNRAVYTKIMLITGLLASCDLNFMKLMFEDRFYCFNRDFNIGEKCAVFVSSSQLKASVTKSSLIYSAFCPTISSL